MAKGPDRTWTHAELRRLEELRELALHDHEIARALGRSVSSVRAQLKRLGLNMSLRLVRWLPELQGPWDAKALARRMGCSLKLVYHYRDQARDGGWL